MTRQNRVAAKSAVWNSAAPLKQILEWTAHALRQPDVCLKLNRLRQLSFGMRISCLV